MTRRYRDEDDQDYDEDEGAARPPRRSLLVRVLRLLGGTLLVAGLATALAVVIYAIPLDTTVREKFEEYGLDARAFSGLKIAAVGDKTAAAIAAWGLRARAHAPARADSHTSGSAAPPRRAATCMAG